MYALFYTNFSAVIIGLFAFGALVLLFYTWPLKYLALGELSIFLIWGPILVAAVYSVLARGITAQCMVCGSGGRAIWVNCYISINFGKHIDKSAEDKKKGVGTLPVRLGEKTARYINMAVLVLIYLVILYLIFVPRFFTPVMLIVLLAGRRLVYAVGVPGQAAPNASRPRIGPALSPGSPVLPFTTTGCSRTCSCWVCWQTCYMRIFLPAFWVMH